MMRPEVLVLAGLPASGKSRRATEWLMEDSDARIVVNYDSLRKGMFGDDWLWNRKDEDRMKAHARSIVERSLKAGLSVCIDNTNLSQKVRAGWAEMANSFGASYVEEEIDTPRALCIARDRQRSARAGQAVIDRMALLYGFIDWAEHGRLCHGGTCTNAAQRPIAIVDVDGTVADCRHRLRHLKPDPAVECTGCGKRFNIGPDACPCDQREHPIKQIPKNWAAFYDGIREDKPIQRMISLVQKLGHDHLIAIVSGRPIQNGRTPVGIWTEDWLLQHKVPFDYLFLRQAGDSRRDYEHKGEILGHIPHDRVAYVFEDRGQCVEMYRRELPNAIVAQIADGQY